MKAKSASARKKIETIKKTPIRTTNNKDITSAVLAAQAAEDKKGKDLLLLDVSKLTAISDYFLIISAESNIQVQAIANFVEATLSEKGFKPIAREGFSHASWIVVDYGDLVVHVMHEKEREFYKLERFWSNATTVDKKVWKKDS